MLRHSNNESVEPKSIFQRVLLRSVHGHLRTVNEEFLTRSIHPLDEEFTNTYAIDLNLFRIVIHNDSK